MAGSVTLVVEQLRRPVPGGIGVYARSLTRALRSLHHRPDMVLHASRWSGDEADPLKAFGFPLDISPLPGVALTRAWDRGLLAPPGGTDLVHATSLAFPPGGRSNGAARPVSVTVHDVAWREVPEAFPPRGRRWHEAALARCRRKATAVVVPAQHVADALVADGFEAGRVHLVEDGCDHLPAPDAAGADALLERLGVDGPFVLTVSTLEPRKNLPRLVAAFRLARPRLPGPWPLVVVGPRGWGPELPPAEGVALAGLVSDGVLAALYRRCRLFAFVPLHEGFGLPAVEAMHAGAPVLAARGRVPSGADAMHEVDPLDPAAIADGIVAVATDDSLRADLVERGRVRASQLSWAAVARAHVDLWESL